jgi:hypothetical protein
MSAFIVIVDTPHFGKTVANGRASLRELDAGRYTLRVWYPDMRDEPKPQSITLTGDQRASATFVAHGRP